jgi:transmembrane sensor
MDESQVQHLLEKYNSGQCSAEEKARLETWYLQHNQELPHGLSKEKISKATDRIWARLDDRAPKRNLLPFIRYAAAASVIFVLGFGGYLLLRKQIVPQSAAVVKQDVEPGGTRAILTLAGGQKIALNNQQGQIASQGQTTILLNAKGNINYQTTANEIATAEIYNTLTVPIGNHRDMTLSDGTEVSLDAGSSITYPVAFNQAERKVTITGQAYFKVKHDAAHPFLVKVKDLTIRDIGTEFNVNAYEEEGGVKTTLIEGSVKVNNKTLKPGEQAVAKGGQITVQPADVDVITAWRNNDFLFRKQDLRTTMRQIARWYNVEIVYDQAPEHARVWADISRERKLSVILQAIEQTSNIKFKIEGKTVTVSK